MALLLVLRWHRAARYLAVTMAATCLLLAIMPAGHLVSQALENRFPANPPLPEKVAGIVVLGGVISPYLSQARGQVQFGDGMERVAATVDLMRRYPNARVIFTGGAGDPFHQDLKEAHFAPDVFAAFGADPGRVMFEAESRNTFENAKFSL
ncbi:MAG: YdcF family protein, partial [Rhodospirillaceae bacterium]